jgi:glycosyltransferase involved in cell wall biosynthesis
MRINIIADPKIPVPPNNYGGTERIVGILCQELQKREHQVTLMAAPKSKNYGRLITHFPPNHSYLSRAYRKILFQFLSFKEMQQADIICNFGRVDYLLTLLKFNKPLIVRFGNPILEEQITWLTAQRSRKMLFVSVSNHQRSHVSHLGKWKTISNGADTERFSFVEQPRGEPYLAFLGRLTYNKGVHLAIKTAKATGMKLKIAGNISDESGGKEYFESQIKPNLDDFQIKWIGTVNDQEKTEFLGNATALLCPIQWDDPCPNVVVESLACGTPVIAINRASMSELIVDRVTGFLCQNEAEMIEAVKQLDKINRQNCRTDCEQRFSVKVMVDGYLKVFQEVIE